MIAKLEDRNRSISLLTDLYQLTMAYGYWNVNMQDKESGLWKIKINWNIDDSEYYFEDIIILGLGG